ncbi:MAG: tetratricopeptide repeat protein [Bryobacteraceae bacterium]
MNVRVIAVGILVAAGALAQQKLGTVNAETPEGALLQQIGTEQDQAKRIVLLEDFASKFPKHEGIGWVLANAQAAYVKAGDVDKVIETGEKLIAHDPNDLDCAYETLQAAVKKVNPDAVIKWSALTAQVAAKVAASPKPGDEDEVEAWKARVDRARQIIPRSEFELYNVALQAQDPRKRIELVEALRQRNPKSEYMSKMNSLAFVSFRQIGDNDKTLAAAERILATDQSDEDILAFVADQYSQKKRDPDKIIEYANKLVEVLNTKPKPEGASDADWTKKKETLLGLGHFMSGSTYFNQKKYKQADTSLRAALPFTTGNDTLKGATLFFLGLSNHNMGNYNDALNFSQQCAAVKSQFQAKAAENVRVMKQQGPPAPKKKK